jgi:hypothetical protein
VIRFRLFLLLLLLLLILTPLAGYGELPELRPHAGKGIVVLPVSTSQELILYELPGIRRDETIRQKGLPTLAPFVRVKANESALAVMSLREGWLRIVYDAAGREAWVELKDTWSYRPWERYLVGRTVRLVSGLKEPLYRFRSLPRDKGEQSGAVTPGFPLRVQSVIDDWAEVVTAGQAPGWLRWRDGDGRLLVTVE